MAQKARKKADLYRGRLPALCSCLVPQLFLGWKPKNRTASVLPHLHIYYCFLTDRGASLSAVVSFVSITILR